MVTDHSPVDRAIGSGTVPEGEGRESGRSGTMAACRERHRLELLSSYDSGVLRQAAIERIVICS